MIKAEKVKKEEKTYVNSAIEGTVEEVLLEFVAIVENLRDSFPEPMLLSAFAKGCARYDLKKDEDKCKEELKDFLKELLNVLQ